MVLEINPLNESIFSHSDIFEARAVGGQGISEQYLKYAATRVSLFNLKVETLSSLRAYESIVEEQGSQTELNRIQIKDYEYNALTNFMGGLND